MNKRLLLRIGLLLGIVFFGLYEAEAQIAKKLKIELGETYRNDQVKIFLDKKLVYDNRISTPDSTSLADLFYVNKPRKPFTVTVEINGTRFEKSSPKQKKELNDEHYSLLINYNREKEEVDMKTHTLIILYD